MTRKIIGIVLICAAIIVPFAAFEVLPSIGDPNSAANTHVAAYYIEHTIEEANSPNMVTSVIVDFRAVDTLLETTVMFLAGVCVMVILSSVFRTARRYIIPTKVKRLYISDGDAVYNSVNKDVVITIIQPIILLYAIYVLFHGEVSLGGGFQAGALIGMVFLLDRMVIPDNRNFPDISKGTAAMLAGVGTFIYAATGIFTMMGGGKFLQYSSFPLEMEIAEKHSVGILLVEIGVTLGVAGTIICITNAILERVRFDDDDFN